MKNKKVKKILNDLIIEKYNMTKLQRILHDLGMTQAYLAQISNLETYQVNKICNGKGKKISMETAKKICKALKLTLDDVFGDD